MGGDGVKDAIAEGSDGQLVVRSGNRDSTVAIRAFARQWSALLVRYTHSLTPVPT